MEDLKDQYKQTRRVLHKAYDDLKLLRDTKQEEQHRLMAKLTLITTWQIEREALEDAIAKLEADMKLIGQMRSDAEYILEWLETGKQPGNRRGIERRAAYQRERPVDPLIIQAYAAKTLSGGTVQISDSDWSRIENALSTLSPRERECFVMTRGSGVSLDKAASMLKLTKSSVQPYVAVADKKLRSYIGRANPHTNATIQ